MPWFGVILKNKLKSKVAQSSQAYIATIVSSPQNKGEQHKISVICLQMYGIDGELIHIVTDHNGNAAATIAGLRS